VVIVNATRDDLRDEFAMADEAFALSPISARAALPSEEDYDAIREAFMETSRGRWFLGEYAKRNRNADTSMVLDAVARIEETLAAQKPPAPASGLVEALVAITGAVDEAKAVAVTALDGLALEETLAPVRKGVRVIKEISWRWREIGADGRICDLIDSQVSAIEGACGQISSATPKTALSAAFDLLKERIAEFDESDAAMPPPAAREATSSASPTPSDEMPDEIPAATVETVQDRASAAASPSAVPAEADLAVADLAIADLAAADLAAAGDAADVMVEAPDVTAEVADATAEADAHDDAVLDMIALEMAAPDPSFPDDPPYPDDAADAAEPAAEPAPAEPIMVASKPEPVAAPVPPPAPQYSLGSSLIANGIVRRPNASLSDPLAPIRRMSQAEKIALFS
jgi:hypothetical protein